MTLAAGENVRVIRAILSPAIVQRRTVLPIVVSQIVLLCYFFDFLFLKGRA